MHMRAMDPGSDRAPANVYGRASLGALTKAEMAERLVNEIGFNQREAGEIVEQFFDEIVGVLAANEPVKFSGFGNFTPRDKGARPGRNPKTGAPFLITARRVVTFRAGRKLKARMEAYAEPRSVGRPTEGQSR